MLQYAKYQVQVLVKYSFFKKVLSTFISSTSKICSKVRMDIQSRVNFGWTKQQASPNHVCSKGLLFS